MKKLLMAITALSFLTACGDAKKEGTKGADDKPKETAEVKDTKPTGAGGDKLPGKWQLESVSGENLTASEKTATIDFRADGTFTQTKQDKQRTGNWLYEGEGSRFINMTVDGKSDPLQLVSCDGSIMKAVVVKNNMISTDTLTFKKI
jgi:hypothetical protein